MLYAWRPFILELWGAIYDRRRVGQRIWVKQILKTLLWISMFMRRQRGSLTRTWTYNSWLNPQTILTMILDASPYGLGGVLISSDRTLCDFASPLTHHDEEIHGHAIGSDKGQQVWDVLFILVAMRTWTSSWLGCQCTLTIKSDNISALVMASKLKVTASTLIAQELALILSEASYMPRHVVHVPGAMNAWADALSRLEDPTRRYTVPAALRDTPRAFPCVRSSRYYSTLAHQ